MLAFHLGKHVSSNLYFIIVLNFFHCYWQLWKTSLVLCWVLFISTIWWGRFNKCWLIVITHYVGFFSFLRKQNLIWIWNWNVITHYVGFFSFLLVKLSAKHVHVYRYYPLCWVLFISTNRMCGCCNHSLYVITHYVGFFSFLQLYRMQVDVIVKCYYPLCWVLFISTVPLQKPSKIKAFQGHFCKYLSEYSEKRVFQPLFCACQNFTPDSSYPSIYF